MSFIALVISLLLERLLGEYARLREPTWYNRYVAWMHGQLGGQQFWAGPLGVLVIVAVPTVLVGLVHQLLGGAFLSLLALIFSVAVLLFCLGPRDLDIEASAYVEAVSAGEEERAAALATDIIGRPTPAQGERRDREVAEAVLLQFNERTFAVIFWFVILGPLGAILYRTSALANRVGDGSGDSGFSEAAQRLHGILDWVPARLIALGFALAGSFEEAVTDWKSCYERRTGEHFWELNAQVIVSAGCGAARLGDSDETGGGTSGVRAALALTLRTLVVWIVLFGMLTIAGFAF